MASIGVMLCGHGSRDPGAVAEFAALAAELPRHLPADWMVAHGYLEFANPVIRDGLTVARPLMNLSSSFDHRIVDGSLAAAFVQGLRRSLEHPALLFVD